MTLIQGADIRIELLLTTATPHGEAVRSGLIGYWRLGDQSGSVAHATVGAAAAYYGSPTLGVPGLLTGDTDTAVRFSGAVAAQYMLLPASARVTGAHSAFVWFERLGPSDGTGSKVSQFLVGKLRGQAADTHPRLVINSAGTSGTWSGYDATNILRTSAALPIPVVAGRHFYGWTYDGNAAQAYLDGVAWGAPTACVGLRAAGTALPQVGSEAAGVNQANGVFDELRIYNRAITPAEVAELYRTGTEGWGEWVELTCETTSATWSWGTSEPLGPLTESEGGTLRTSLYDPTGKYNPEDPASPLYGVLKAGLAMRVLVDDSPAWTGALQTWSWDRGSGISDLNALDPIGQLSLRVPYGGVMSAGAITTTEQITYMLDQAEWPNSKRHYPTGSPGIGRGAHYIDGSVLDGILAVRWAELGAIYANRNGDITWVTREGVTPPPVSVTINCGGVGLTDLWIAAGLGRIRNRVVIQDAPPPIMAGDIPPEEQRNVFSRADFLNFIYAGAPAPLPQDLWADHILAALATVKPVTMLGTIVPQGAEVKAVLCSEYGSRWTISSPEYGDRIVAMLGQTVSLSPGWIEVDAVTEDV